MEDDSLNNKWYNILNGDESIDQSPADDGFDIEHIEKEPESEDGLQWEEPSIETGDFPEEPCEESYVSPMERQYNESPDSFEEPYPEEVHILDEPCDLQGSAPEAPVTEAEIPPYMPMTEIIPTEKLTESEIGELERKAAVEERLSNQRLARWLVSGILIFLGANCLIALGLYAFRFKEFFDVYKEIFTPIQYVLFSLLGFLFGERVAASKK